MVLPVITCTVSKQHGSMTSSHGVDTLTWPLVVGPNSEQTRSVHSIRVVLGLDANEDVREGTVQQDLVGMFEAINNHHPTKSVHAACNKNKSRNSIDGI